MSGRKTGRSEANDPCIKIDIPSIYTRLRDNGHGDDDDDQHDEYDNDKVLFPRYCTESIVLSECGVYFVSVRNQLHLMYISYYATDNDDFDDT